MLVAFQRQCSPTTSSLSDHSNIWNAPNGIRRAKKQVTSFLVFKRKQEQQNKNRQKYKLTWGKYFQRKTLPKREVVPGRAKCPTLIFGSVNCWEVVSSGSMGSDGFCYEWPLSWWLGFLTRNGCANECPITSGGRGDKHWKITFCCCYAAEAATGLRPVEPTVLGGATNHKALITTRPCAGSGVSRCDVGGCYVNVRTCRVTRGTWIGLRLGLDLSV